MSARSFVTPAIVAVLLLAAACSPDEGREGIRDSGAVDAETPSSEPSPGATRPARRDFDPRRITVRLRPIARGFESPLFVTHAGDGTGRLFVVEQDGLIWVLQDGEVLEPPFLDITGDTEGDGEQGLLGLAFHPQYRNNGRFFVNYTDNNGDTVVAEYQTRGNRGDPTSRRVLLQISQPFANHNGGALIFGPDGYLYIATGDGGSGGDPLGNGQSLNTLLGKLLRIDVDSRAKGQAYAIPPDNPFVGRDGEDEIWAYGLRNPWRFSFDADTLWIADVGQNELEEINRARATQGGLNYGWNITEGNACYEVEGCNRDGLTGPIATYTHDDGCSVTGGYVYRGRDYPELFGGYFFADYCSGRVWALDAAGPASQRPVELMATDRLLSSFGVDQNGEIYLTDLSSGEILRLVGD